MRLRKDIPYRNMDAYRQAKRRQSGKVIRMTMITECFVVLLAALLTAGAGLEDLRAMFTIERPEEPVPEVRYEEPVQESYEADDYEELPEEEPEEGEAPEEKKESEESEIQEPEDKVEESGQNPSEEPSDSEIQVDPIPDSEPEVVPEVPESGDFNTPETSEQTEEAQ